MLPTIPVQKLSVHATLPTKGTAGSAGFDMYATDEHVVATGTRLLIPTDIAMSIPRGYVGILKSRSSMACKYLDTEAGVIDSDYRGNIKVLLHNHGDTNYVVHKNDKIAQMLILPIVSLELEETDKLQDTSRGTEGFGSTGK